MDAAFYREIERERERVYIARKFINLIYNASMEDLKQFN